MRGCKKVVKNAAIFVTAAIAACIMLVAAPKTVEAAVPGQVQGLNVKDIFCQQGIAYLTWTPDSQALIYEVEVYAANNQKITSGWLYAYNYNPNLGVRISSNLMKGKTFQFRVRAIGADAAGEPAYGAWSQNKVVVPYANITKFTNKGNNTVSVKWQKVKGAKNYTVYVRIGEKGKYKKVKTVKGTTCDVKGMKNGKKAYFYVVANKVKVNGKSYSTIKSETPDWTSIVYRPNVRRWT